MTDAATLLVLLYPTSAERLSYVIPDLDVEYVDEDIEIHIPRFVEILPFSSPSHHRK